MPTRNEAAAPTGNLSGETEPMTLPIPPPPMPGSAAIAPPPPPIARAPVAKPAAPKVATAPYVATPPTTKPPPVPATEPRSVPKDSGGLSREIDDAFAGATDEAAPSTGPGRIRNDATTKKDIEKLFEDIAAQHTAQLREFIGELTASPTSKLWADICAPSLEVLRRGADQIDHARLSQALGELERALDAARRGGAARIDGPERDKLLDRYRVLVRIVPAAFEVTQRRQRREPIIVHTLLEQVDGISSLAISKFYKAGLTSLSKMYAADTTDVAAATGLDPELCKRVLAHFAEYHRRRVDDPQAARLDAERGRLVGLLRQIDDCQIAFRQAEFDEDSGRKRRARNRRGALLRDVQLALAHLGQLELIDEISRLPVDRKVETVNRWLRQRAAG